MELPASVWHGWEHSHIILIYLFKLSDPCWPTQMPVCQSLSLYSCCVLVSFTVKNIYIDTFTEKQNLYEDSSAFGLGLFLECVCYLYLSGVFVFLWLGNFFNSLFFSFPLTCLTHRRRIGTRTSAFDLYMTSPTCLRPENSWERSWLEKR